ncbi:hypothetical protein F66182_3433 [Fusarium sp. NRRL 66182]|nr:hypothetical protein F66182_3433 [Fusarium sp. NRRL 66182]
MESKNQQDMPLETQSRFVDWDGPDDAKDPYNWASWKQDSHIALVSILALAVNLASTLFAPAAPELASEFAVTEPVVASLTVTIYLLGFSFGPLVVSPLSELYGRLKIYHACNVCFIAFNVGCAMSQSLAPFLACRLLAGCAGSAPMTIGGGTIADLTAVEKRGKAMAVFGIGPLLGPVLGPIVGGFAAQYLGWRWTLWLIVILSGVTTIACFLFMRETYAPVLLAAKVARLRKENNNSHLVAKGASDTKRLTLLLRAIVRPTKMLLLSPVVLGLSLYNAFVFGLIFLLFTTFPTVFSDKYGFGLGTSGLSYLGIGLGTFAGLIIFSLVSDRVVQRRRKDGPAKPEHRLPLMIWTCPLIPVGFFWYGWSADAGTHWIVPILGTALIGVGALFIVISSQIYVVDAFGAEGAASALAALTVIRCLFGCFLPMAGPLLYHSVGLGWGNSILGFIGLLFLPVPFAFYTYGEYLRKRFPVQL